VTEFDKDPLQQALWLSRRGDVEGGIEILEAAGNMGALSMDAVGLHFMLLVRIDRRQEAVDVCSAAIVRFDDLPLHKSKWLLRRGLLYVELERRDEALADLQSVLTMGANEDHQATARATMLKVADLAGVH
jgi:tetratricopeptide (TPR) repeat protein